MSTAREQSKEMVIFCQNEVKRSKTRVLKTWLEKAVLQGVMVALLVIASQSGPGNTLQRSNGWASF